MNPFFSTLPNLLRHVSQNHRNPTALAYKRDGAWVSISTAEMMDTVRKIGTGLLALGLKPGDKIGIVAEPSPFWMMTDFAILGCGGITVPMFSNIAPDNLRHEIQDSGIRFAFVGTEKQYQALQPFAGSMERILSLPGASESSEYLSWEALIRSGGKRLESQPGEWDRLADAVKESDTATLIYTSGSMGVPKGVELTHKNLVSQVIGTADYFPLNPEKDRILTCLPLAHVFERMVAYYYFSTGSSIYFAEDVKKVGGNLRETRPTIITLVPRLFEKVFAKIQSGVESSTGFKKFLGRAAIKRAREKPYDAPSTFMDGLFDFLVYRKMREALGGNLRLVISGGAPLDPALGGFFLNIGVPVFEGYGLTETSPVIAVNYPGHRKMGTVGRLFPGVEVRMGDDGEILMRGAGQMKGYYGNPEETARTIDAAGWLHTGDLGFMDDEGFLKITGRKKELFKTANGKYVAPVPIEQALLANRLVDMAFIVAEGRPFTSVVLFPDMENLPVLKAELGCSDMDNAAFFKSEQVRSSLQNTLDEVNAKLNHWEKVQKFHLAQRALSVEEGELTPTMKIRRHVVAEKFRREIGAMYAGRGDS